MKAKVLIALLVVGLSAHGQTVAPSNGQAPAPPYTQATPPLNGRTAPFPAPPSSSMALSPDGVFTTGSGIHFGPHPSNDPSTPEEWRLSLVARLIALPSPVHNGAPQLYGMGDEAATDIVRILGTRAPLTVAEQRSTLDVIHMSFEHPESIVDPNYRKPLATLFLLQYIGTATEDASIRNRVNAELEFARAIKPAASVR